MNNVALLILFNHNYEKNIERLEAIYGDRFSNMYFIMPFYTGDKKNVLAVYENSYYFQGYITQALKQIENLAFAHYLFIGDDLILNPEINERNYQSFFSLDDRKAFIPDFFTLNNPKEFRPYRPFSPYWTHQNSALDFKIRQVGIEIAKYLPSYDEAKSFLKRHGIHFTDKMPRGMFVPKPLFKTNESVIHNLRRLKVFIKNIQHILSPPKIPYPLVGSYSDILIIPHEYKEKFILYSGIFAALHLFVEIAIPTALAYAVPEVVTEKDLEKKGRTYWGEKDFKNLEIEYNSSFKQLIENFPEKCLYVHPVKLSSWK
jgi:hypothetical protein